MKTLTKVKIAVPLIIFCIILTGLLFRASAGGHSGRIPVFISYSLIVAIVWYFIVDFISAAGYLQRKIRFVQLLAAYFVFLIIINRFELLSPEMQLILTGLISAFIIIFDIFFSPPRDFDFISDVKKLPKKYLKPHLLRTALETIFRLFPVPVPVALYKVGNPNEKSHVIVTGNYELTVRRVAKAIQGSDCWLLVCDSRGINVWCSTLSGHFSGKSIIQAIKLTNLAKYVSRKRIILPQLCAAGVDLEAIIKETGFRAVFGPVYIERINDFINRRADEAEIRKVKFEFKQRIEMAIGSPIILMALLSFIYLFTGISKLLFIIPLIYFFAGVHAAIYPSRPFKRAVYWAAAYSICVTVILIIVENIIPAITTGTIITIGIGIFYLINEFEGWSPLTKYNFKAMYKGPTIPEIEVDAELCTGCRLCFQVCPKGVFSIESMKAIVVKREECINCTACYTRCPTGAIVHSFDNREGAECGCAYCRAADGINVQKTENL